MGRVLEDVAPVNAEVDFHLFDSDDMARLNENFLDHEGPTDVITFSYLDDDDLDLGDEAPTVGEIFVCPEVAQRAAEELNTTIEQEIMLYLVHGILHLAGYDDVEDDDRQAMRQAEADEMAFLNDRYDVASAFASS